MTRRILGRCILTLPGVFVASLLLAAPAPVGPATGIVQDRENFIPKYKFQAMAGKSIGLLLSDVLPKMMHEGRSSAAENMGFSTGGFSYRWIYVPDRNQPQITGLQVKVGEKGERVQVYPQLSMAKPRTVDQWDIKAAYALVEVEVNDNQGSPAEEGFVATKMTRLDGTKEYPLNVAAAMTEVRKKYAKWKTDQQGKLDEAITSSQKLAIKEKKPTGPRETNELLYATWLPEPKRLSIRFRTTITDGDYKYSGGGIDQDRFPLPPIKRLPGGGPAPAPLPPQGFALFPPPPPRDFPRMRHGTSFGIEFGMAYEVSVEGKIVRELTLPSKAFTTELQPPPIGPGRRFELPPPPRPGRN